MMYGLKLDQEDGLQVVRTEEGVTFEQLPELVFALQDLSEFEQHRAARQLREVNRRPSTQVTNLSHLVKEPLMSFCSQPEDPIQYKLEIYQLPDKGAEIVMEYPTDSEQMPWFALMANAEITKAGSKSSPNIGPDANVVDRNAGDRCVGVQHEVETGTPNIEPVSGLLAEQLPEHKGSASDSAARSGGENMADSCKPSLQSSSSSPAQVWEQNCERLKFSLSQQEMMTILSLCRFVGQR